MTPNDVVAFWMAAGESRWFTRDAAFDGVLKIHFGAAAAAARDGAFADWTASPEGALGLVLLLDQVPRNIYRGLPLAFASDARARDVAHFVLRNNYLHAMPAPRAMWFVLPFEHSENIDDQYRCKALYQTMGLSEMVHWSQIHLDIIARLGRFPHRNKVLGRISMPEEIAFLAAGGFARVSAALAGLRRAGPADAGAIRDLSRQAYAKWVPAIGREPHPMSADYSAAVSAHWIDILEDKTGVFAVIEMIPAPDHLLIENIAIRDDRQGRGLGTALLAHAEAVAKRHGLPELRLYTNAAFTSNIAYYPKRGFTETGRTPLPDGGTMVHFAKPVS